MKFIQPIDFVVGEIYTHVDVSGRRWNVFLWGGRDAFYSTAGDRNRYRGSPGGNFSNPSVEATPFERAWLLEMRRVGHFIPESKFEFFIEYIQHQIY
jgi:hypothetical protein